MKTYRIIEPFTKKIVIEKELRGDKTAKNWIADLCARGIIEGVPVKLQKRVMTDSQAKKLPPFADGRAQSAWADI